MEVLSDLTHFWGHICVSTYKLKLHTHTHTHTHTNTRACVCTAVLQALISRVVHTWVDHSPEPPAKHGCVTRCLRDTARQLCPSTFYQQNFINYIF